MADRFGARCRGAEPARGPAIYEGFVEFEAEFSVILVRGQDGEIRFWDSDPQMHTTAFCHLHPARWRDDRGAGGRGARPCPQVADALKYVGVLTLEFFATREGPVFNEMAPRVHNSGHWSIEGAATSQFENHIRAMAGLPLGDTGCVARSVTMMPTSSAARSRRTHAERADTASA